MAQSFLEWVIKIFPSSSSFYSYYGNYSDISPLKDWVNEKNKKGVEKFGTKLFKSLNFDFYKEYFDLLKSMGLQTDFEIKSSKDGVTIKGSLIKSFFVNNLNKDKVIIFCHGVSNNRWSLFYQIYLAIQMGYVVITYDARNHGFSEKSYTTLGKIESEDLEDVLSWCLTNIKPKNVGLYGFSMGASTVIYWTGKFQDQHPQVKAVFCEAPFDDFSKRFSSFLKNKKYQSEIDKVEISNKESEENYFYKAKNYFFYNLASKILKVPFELEEIKPISSLPKIVKPKFLLIHGLSDEIINYNSSVEIWNKLSKNNNNDDKIKFFLVKGAGHGDVFFAGDFLKEEISSYKDNEKNKKKNYSSIFYSFFSENL